MIDIDENKETEEPSQYKMQFNQNKNAASNFFLSHCMILIFFHILLQLITIFDHGYVPFMQHYYYHVKF